VHGADLDQAAPATVAWAWKHAERFALAAGPKAGEANEAMMELGATVCTPASSPACDLCPLAGVCTAKAERLQDRIPRPKKTKAPQARFMAVLLLRDRAGRLLCERRPTTGLWAGLWQPVTLEPEPEAAAGVQAWLDAGGDGLNLAKATSITRTLTHRRVRIDVYHAAAKASWLRRVIGPAEARASGIERRWATVEELEALGVSRAHGESIRAAMHVAMHSRASVLHAFT
jgi:A/G-specific adenine glycosylase